jgi:hypothetical protein
MPTGFDSLRDRGSAQVFVPSPCLIGDQGIVASFYGGSRTAILLLAVQFPTLRQVRRKQKSMFTARRRGQTAHASSPNAYWSAPHIIVLHDLSQVRIMSEPSVGTHWPAARWHCHPGAKRREQRESRERTIRLQASGIDSIWRVEPTLQNQRTAAKGCPRSCPRSKRDGQASRRLRVPIAHRPTSQLGLFPREQVGYFTVSASGICWLMVPSLAVMIRVYCPDGAPANASCIAFDPPPPHAQRTNCKSNKLTGNRRFFSPVVIPTGNISAPRITSPHCQDRCRGSVRGSACVI